MEPRGRIDYIPEFVTETGTTRWRRPWVLKVWRFGVWAVAGYYTTHAGAQAAARRAGIKVHA